MTPARPTDGPTPPNALIIPDPQAEADSADELSAALSEAGAVVRRASVDEVVRLGHDGPPPEVVLMHARLGGAEVAALLQALAGDAGRVPAVLVFADSDHSLLLPHLDAGHDYLLPPFPPQLVRRRLTGCLQAAVAHTAEDFSAATEQLLKYEREMQIGREIQQGFLPELLASPDGWEVAARFRPAQVVGGDFYDSFQLLDGRRTAFVVADVCDKGVGAALFMALIRTLLRHTAQQEVVSLSDGPAQLIRAVSGTNDYMTRNHLEQGYFATLFFAVLEPETGEFVYVNGGHNPPLLLRADGSLQPLEPTGPAVGLIPGSAFHLGRTVLAPGETLFAYTDGVTDARNGQGEFFSESRMLDLLRAPIRSAKDLLDRVDLAVRRFAGATEQFDDLTMLAVRHLPPPAAA